MPSAPERPLVPLHELVDEWAHSQLAAVEEVRPCACGTAIVADPRDPGPAVARHQAEPRHAAFARRVYGSDEAQPERPTAGPSPVDVSGPTPRASAAPAGKPIARAG
jgi:hypothetical protein